IPSLESVSVTPQVADPGVSMGQRESVRVVLADHPHSDAGLDKYLAERDYDAFRRGTFWGKLRARITTLKGLPLRVRIGERGQAHSALSHREHGRTGRARVLDHGQGRAQGRGWRSRAGAGRIARTTRRGDIRE